MKIECCTKVFLWQIYVLGNENKHSDPHVKFPIFWPEFKQICIFSTDFDKKSPVSNFTEICPLEAALMHADRRIDTDGHDEANRRFSRLCEKPKNTFLV